VFLRGICEENLRMKYLANFRVFCGEFLAKKWEKFMDEKKELSNEKNGNFWIIKMRIFRRGK
jgi:hypothetical protein